MQRIGIRALRDRLSHWIRRVEAGERVVVTDRGRVVAELVPAARRSRYDDLVAAGLIRPALEQGDPLEGFVPLNLPPGTAAALIDADRGE